MTTPVDLSDPKAWGFAVCITPKTKSVQDRSDWVPWLWDTCGDGWHIQYGFIFFRNPEHATLFRLKFEL